MMDDKRLLHYLIMLNSTFKEKKTLGVITFVIQEGRVEIKSDGFVSDAQLLELANIMKTQAQEYIDTITKNIEEEKKQSNIH